MDVMPTDQLLQKLPSAVATNTAPDFVLFGIENMATYIKSGALMPIDDFWEKTGVDKSNFLDNVLEFSYIDGVQYGTPMQYNTVMLFWNKSLYRAAGLDPDKPPKTLKEMSEYAVKLTDSSKNQFGLALPADGATGLYPAFFWNNGGGVFDLATEKNELYSQSNIDTLTWLQDLVVNKKVSPKGLTGADADMMIQNAQLAMYMSGPWEINGLKNMGVDFGVAPIPAGATTQKAPAGGCDFVIPKGTSDEHRYAAYDFMRYWLTDANLKHWSQYAGFPVWSKTLLADNDIKSDSVLYAVSEATKIAQNYNIGYSKAKQVDYDVMIPLFEKVFSDSVSPEEALKEAAAKLDSVIMAK